MQARPRLSKISPLASFVCWGYGLFNLFLGTVMFLLYRSTVPIAVADIFSYKIWGVLFILTGLAGLVGLVINHWSLVRHSQLFGITLKATWLIALIIVSVSFPQTWGVTLVWAFLLYVQWGVYIYFLPPEIYNV